MVLDGSSMFYDSYDSVALYLAKEQKMLFGISNRVHAQLRLYWLNNVNARTLAKTHMEPLYLLD